VQITNANNWLTIDSATYSLDYDGGKPHFVTLRFQNGVEAELFVASGCDRDDGIDELIELSKPELIERDGATRLVFTGKTTLWEKVEYIFELQDERVIYSYRVHGTGKLEVARYFEGFLQNDPRTGDGFYPYFCGPGRHLSHHRSVKEFQTSSKPGFDRIFSFGINSTDKREFGHYENIRIRVDGDRHYLGGDWLATPAPFLYLMGRKQTRGWVSLGLCPKIGEAGFLGYDYLGGEGFGLSLDYNGYTEVNGTWESPAMLLEQSGADVYEALAKHTSFLQESGCMPAKDRAKTPAWWKKAIFGGWGEQVFHSNRWENYFSGRHNDWAHDNVDQFCTQAAYETMLRQLEEKGINPTILIIDNRWFDNRSHMEVEPALWPDLKGFIRDQHTKGRKVILWVSPFGYCKSSKGKNVPLVESMFVDEDELYNLEIDTDVFYPACKREIKKVRKYYPLPTPTLTDANWRYVADPQNPAYAGRLRKKIHELLSPEGYDADGFEFDYTHFLPKFRGTKPVTDREEKTRWGIEALHGMVELFYKSAKAAKADSLIISHTFNPYFNDVVDMLRLQDIYTDRRSIVAQMEHRAKIAHLVAPGCAVHTDQHPMPSLEAWREYAKFQPTIGNPCTYYTTGIETTRECFTDEDFKMLKQVWEDYDKTLESGK